MKQIMRIIMVICCCACFHNTSSDLMAAPAQTPASGDPHQHIQQIMQRPIYQRWRLRDEGIERPKPQILKDFAATVEVLIQKIKDWLDQLFSNKNKGLFSGMNVNSGKLNLFLKTMGWCAIGLFVIAMVALIWKILQGRHLTINTARVLSREQVTQALQQGDALALAGDQWLDEAGRLANEKNFRAMYRALYLAMLSGLHAANRIDFNRQRTNWTYVHHFRGNVEQVRIFSSLTALFDDVWYGNKESPHADIATLQQQVRSLIAQETTENQAVSGTQGGGPRHAV